MNRPVCLELICSSCDRVIFPRQACYLFTLAMLACLAVSNVGRVNDFLLFLWSCWLRKAELMFSFQQRRAWKKRGWKNINNSNLFFTVHSRNTVVVSLISFLALARVWMDESVMGLWDVCVSCVRTRCPLNHPDCDLHIRNGVKWCSCWNFGAFLPVRWVRFRPKYHICRRREAGSTHIIIRNKTRGLFLSKKLL